MGIMAAMRPAQGRGRAGLQPVTAATRTMPPLKSVRMLGHTLRYCFAMHLLQAESDIRMVQGADRPDRAPDSLAWLHCRLCTR